MRHQLLVQPATFPPGGTESRRRLRNSALFIGAAIQDFFLAAALSPYFGPSPPAAGDGRPFDYITDPRVSPFAAANGHAGLAPATVVLGEADPLRDEGRLYADALRTAAVPTHVLEYRRHAASVMIVNAHPVYGCAAYAAGAINEPTTHAPPTFEVRQLALTLAPEQDGEALQHWRAFAAAFPDVLDSGNAPFFVSQHSQYAHGDEAAAQRGGHHPR